MTVQCAMTGLLLGLGASLIMDGWAILRRGLTGAPILDYGWITRWIAGLPAGRLSLSPVQEPSLSALDRIMGWLLHYMIGAGFAVAFLMIIGTQWLTSPTLTPALVFGGVTALAPFLILQPALGRGVFASRTPSPRSARIQTILTHLVFGLGLYVTAQGLALVRA